MAENTFHEVAGFAFEAVPLGAHRNLRLAGKQRLDGELPLSGQTNSKDAANYNYYARGVVPQ